MRNIPRHRLMAAALAALATGAMLSPGSAFADDTRDAIDAYAPDLGVLNITCADAASENCYALPIDRYDIGSLPLYDDEDSLEGVAANAASTVTSDSYTGRRTATNYVGIKWDGMSSRAANGGISGTDFSMLSQYVNGNKDYLPCKNINDRYQGACVTPGKSGYYRTARYPNGSGNPYPVGINVGNKGSVSGTTTTCPANDCKHDWGNKLYRIDPEFYPKRISNGVEATDFDYVRNRFAMANNFTATAPGGGLQQVTTVGTISEKKLGESGTARARGSIVDELGLAAAAGRVQFSIFEKGANGRSSNATPLQSFAAFSNVNGMYSTGALYANEFFFKILVKDQLDTTKIIKCRTAIVSIRSLSTLQNVDLRRDDLGLPSPSAC